MGRSEYTAWGKPVDMYDKKVHKKLKKKNPDLFKKLFKFNSPATFKDSMLVHINPTKLEIVFVPNASDKVAQAVVENVFICLSYSSWEQDDPLKEYLVSKQYNVNFSSDSLENYIAAQFVFYRSELSTAHAIAETSDTQALHKPLKVLAIAEEPDAQALLKSQTVDAIAKKFDVLAPLKSLTDDSIVKEHDVALAFFKFLTVDAITKKPYAQALRKPLARLAIVKTPTAPSLPQPLKVQAIAEEPAQALPISSGRLHMNVEQLYLSRRQKNKPGTRHI